MRKLFLFLIVAAASSQAQYPHHRPIPTMTPSPITVGGYFSVGGESNDTPAQTTSILFPIVGVFADFTRHPIRPGVDLRGQGGTSGIRGTLIGPRVSANYGPLHPYAEFLLGPNHYLLQSVALDQDKHGFTTKGVIGIDIDATPNMSWRVVEFSVGNFNGIPDSHPQSFSTGIVLRLP